MPILTWDDSFDVKVDEMNREHASILHGMNLIYDATQEGKPLDLIMRMITRLAEVTTRHFADEEAFMRRCGYPDYENHCAIHRKLLKDFGDHVGRITASGSLPGADFFSFLRLWLSAHIKCIDRKYGDHATRTARAA